MDTIFDGWEPTTVTARDTIPEGSVRRLHGLLDATDPVPSADAPALWHWLAFLPDTPQRDLGPDGHPRPGPFLPPTDLPRRMYAGGQLTWRAAIPVGVPLTRRSVVTSVRGKVGRTGRLVFVTVEHRLGFARMPEALVERTDLVYRAMPTDEPPQPEPADIDEQAWLWRWELDVDPTVLFRFSALTYNAHRIHYDRDYATKVEGYPGLVVHGPLQALALAELCRRNDPRSIVEFRFTALAPAFDEGPLRLRARPEGDAVQLAAFSARGVAVMRAVARLR